MIKIEKFKKLRKGRKSKDVDSKKGKERNDRFYVRETHTPNCKITRNKLPQNHNHTHLKIKSRDLKSIDNLINDEELTQNINITTANIKQETKIIIKSKKLKPNKSSHNLQTFKIIKALTIDENNSSNDINNIFQKIKSLWEVLGVTIIYQNMFNKLSKSISDDDIKKNFLINEYDKLTKVFNIINNIITNINSREKIISTLQKYNIENINIENNNANNINQNIDDNKIKEIIDILTDLRNASIQIVENIFQLRQEIGYESLMNKYDINKIYIFPKDYIIKMNHDLDFLIYSQLFKYFNFNKEDPFFLSISNKDNNTKNNQYQIPPMENDKVVIIRNFKNIILTELLYQDLSMTHNYLNNSLSYDSLKVKNKNSHNNLSIKINNNYKNNGKIIKANRGLSRAKLRPKNIKKNIQYDHALDKDKKQIFNNNNNSEIIRYVRNNNLSHNNYESNIKNHEDIDYINDSKNDSHSTHPGKCSEKIIGGQKSPLNEDDLMIFEKIIEQSIREKNNIDKESLDNKYKRQIKINKNINLKNDTNINNINNQNLKIKEKNKHIYTNTSPNPNINKKKEEPNTAISNIFEKSEIEYEINTENNKNKTEIIKKQYQNMTIEVYRGKLSVINNIFKNYYNEIPSKIKIGFNLQSSLLKYIRGIYPKILLLKTLNNKQKLIGLVTLNYETNNSNVSVISKNKYNNYNKILRISSISCINENQFSEILLNTLDFCQNFFSFENMILQLYYQCEKGEFILYKDLESIIKDKTKFKWVNMENDGLNRKIKYKYINRNNNEKDKNNILNVKSVFILGYDESKNYNTLDINNLSLINDFSINYLFIEMIGRHHFKIFDKFNCGNNFLNIILSKIKFKTINQLSGDFITSHIGDSSEIKSFINDNENIFNNNELIEQINNKIYSELLLSIAVLNISSSFKNIIKKNYNNYMYNVLFDTNISIFTVNISNNNNFQLYLIHTNEDNFSVIIYELKNNENEDYFLKMFSNEKCNDNQGDDNDTNMNISELFKKIFSNVNQKPKVVNNKILIPSFKIKSNQFKYRPSIYNSVVLDETDIDKQYKVNSINFIEEISFGVDEPFNVQQNYMDLDLNNSNNENNLFNNDEIIIKNDFIISVVNNDLIYELQIPTISTFIVKKSSWIKSA